MIKIENLNKKFGNTIILNEIDLNIPCGSMFGLLGPNGAGKSTLLRIITNILEIDSGKVILNGNKNPQDFIREFGYLPEERGLYKKMKVGEHVLYMALLKGMNYKDAKSELYYWFEKLNIHDWWDIKVETLSKGMQQKVQFIIAVVHKPKLLILDEPFSGLDPINSEVLIREIKELNANGTTVVLSTHDMDSVDTLCDDIALLNNGKLILTGTVLDIKQKYKSSIIEIGFKQAFYPFISQIENNYHIIEQKKDKFDYYYRLDAKNKDEFKTLLESNFQNIDLYLYNEPLPSLKEIFIKQIKSDECNILHNI